MENISNVSAVKQPSPNVVGLEKNPEPKKEVKRPYVGVINPPVLSPTPLSDVLEKRKAENPRMKYKLTIKKPKILTFQNILSVGIFACGLAVLFPSLKGGIGKISKAFPEIIKAKR